MDLFVLLVLVIICLALLIHIDRGIKLLERIARTLDTAQYRERDSDGNEDGR